MKYTKRVNEGSNFKYQKETRGSDFKANKLFLLLIIINISQNAISQN